MTANVESMVFYGEKPWHGLGTRVDEAATSQEALAASGLGNWQIQKIPLFGKVDSQYGDLEVKIHDKFGIYRQDKGRILGVVGARYTPLQNEEAFAFCDGIVGKECEIKYHTAGSLGQGERVWMLAKINGTREILPGDAVDNYLLFMNSHDGSSAIRVLYTPTRVVCQNTLNLALANSKGGIKLRHTKTVSQKLDAARKVLGFSTEAVSSFMDMAQELSKQQMNTENFRQFYTQLFPKPTLETDESETKLKNWVVRQEAFENLFENGLGQDIAGVRGTKWAALNAVSEYTTHHMKFRKDNDGNEVEEVEEVKPVLAGGYSRWNDVRLDSLMDGKISQLHKQAVYVLTTL